MSYKNVIPTKVGILIMNKQIFLLFYFFLLCSKVFADTPSDIEKGKELYHAYGCALCHGMEGRGDGIGGQRFDPPPTNFYNRMGYLHGSDTDSIRSSIQYGIKEANSIMPSFEHIPPDEMSQIISYLKSLQSKE